MRYPKWSVDSLLTTENEKLVKSRGVNRVFVAAHYLAPASISGRNVCAMSTAGCRDLCLHTAGNPLYMDAKERARIARTNAFYSSRVEYVQALCNEIKSHVRKCDKLGFKPAIRLNGTSDIIWEKIAPQIFEQFPNVQFYDYTKHRKRVPKPRANYKLLYSYSERDTPDDLRDMIARGFNVAVVFAVTPAQALPKKWHGVRVIDGDMTDYRPADPIGVIVGLRAKGKARKNGHGGFVQNV